MRTAWPVRHPSPKKSPAFSIATTASRPDCDTTDNWTLPFWMYSTWSHGSPCVKMLAPRGYSTIFRDTPADARKTWALNVRFDFIAMRDPFETAWSRSRRNES
jgi:hypothetical protein